MLRFNEIACPTDYSLRFTQQKYSSNVLLENTKKKLNRPREIKYEIPFKILCKKYITLKIIKS